MGKSARLQFATNDTKDLSLSAISNYLQTYQYTRAETNAFFYHPRKSRKTSRGRDLKSCNAYFIFIQGSVSRKRPVGKPYLQSFCQLEYSLASRGQRLNFMGILEVENSFKKACRTNKSRGRDISLLIIIPISSKKYEKSTKFGSFFGYSVSTIEADGMQKNNHSVSG
jgi:hypothetical protein